MEESASTVKQCYLADRLYMNYQEGCPQRIGHRNSIICVLVPVILPEQHHSYLRFKKGNSMVEVQL